MWLITLVIQPSVEKLSVRQNTVQTGHSNSGNIVAYGFGDYYYKMAPVA